MLSRMNALLLILAAATAAPPRPVVLETGRDHYFGADNGSSADYLHLRADGRYVALDAQHLFTRVSDTGRWRVENGRAVLESEQAVRDIDAGEFSVHVFDRCGQEHLPALRAKVKALRDRGEPVKTDDYGGVTDAGRDDPRSRRPSGWCGASLDYFPDGAFGEAFTAKRLDAVLAAIDAWLATASTQGRFEYAAWKYRGETFLEPMLPGMHPVQQSAEEVRAEMDRYDGNRASFVLYRMSREAYRERADCTYAFKFQPERNAPCNGGGAD